MAADRPPRERGAVEAQLARALGGEVERRVAPVERIADGLGRRVGEHGQHEALGVPEDVPVVAVARQPLGGDRALLGAGGGLQRVEEGEAHGLLELVVAVDLDVGALPEVVEVLALVLEEAVEPRAPRGRERGVGLVADRDHRALAGPPVGQELGQRQRLAVADLGAHRHAREVVEALVLGDRALAAPRPRGPSPPPSAGRSRACGARARARSSWVPCDSETSGAAQDRGRARVRAARGHVLVGDELGLHDDPRLAVERLDLVADGGHRAVHEGHQAHRAHLDLAPRRRAPVDLAAQHPGAQVERAAVRDQRAVAHVEGLVVDQQADELAVGDVDDGLALLGVAVAGLRVGQRAHLVEGVQVGPGHAVRARPRRGWPAARCGRWRARGPTRPARACRGRAAPR